MTVIRLPDLLRPHDMAAFLAGYWEQRPLLVQRAYADYYGGLFSLADVDRFLATPALVQPSTIRVIRGGRGVDWAEMRRGDRRGDYATVEALLGEYRSGATLALQAVNRVFAPIRDLCHDLATEFSATFQANAYLTPGASQGFDTHADTHDVFVLQIAGAKRWTVFPAPVPLALRSQRFCGSHLPEAELEAELRPGDLLYVPRGFPHHAVSTRSTSLHLTVGAHTVTWAAVLRAALDAQVDKNVRLRASLPPGFARSDQAREAAVERLRELLNALADTVDSRALIGDVAEVTRRQGVVLPGRFLDIEGADDISAATRVSRRAGVECEMRRAADRIRLRFNGKVVSVPAYAEPEMQALLAGGEWRADELPGGVDDAGRVVLIRALVREGLLTLCR